MTPHDHGSELEESNPTTTSRRDIIKFGAVLPVGVTGSTEADSLTGLLSTLEGDETPVDDVLTEVIEVVPQVPEFEEFSDWYAGDLHSHTEYSHDVCESPLCEEPYTWGYSVNEQILNAEIRGLQFIALTDHNTVKAQSDSGYTSNLVTILDGYEHSLSDGHGGFLGVQEYIEEPEETAEGLATMLKRVHEADGVGVINHPRTDISSTWDYETPVSMDAMEVWSIAWYLREELTQGTLSSNNHKGLELYDQYLNAGYQLAAVGGSDSHWRATNLLQGVGQPTTWVKANDTSQTSILESLAQGRTFISWDWLGPLVKLTANPGGRRFNVEVGETAQVSSPVSVRIELANAIGHRVRLVANGTPIAEEVVTSSPYTWETVADLDEAITEYEQGWIRAEVFLEDTFTMRALTSPIYFTEDGAPTDPNPEALAELNSDGYEFDESLSMSGEEGHCSCHSDELREKVYALDIPIGLGRPVDERDVETIGELENAVRSITELF